MMELRIWAPTDVAELLDSEEGLELMDEIMGFLDDHQLDLGPAVQLLLRAGLASYTEAPATTPS